MNKEIEYQIIDVKNSISLIKWGDGKLIHVQTSSLSEAKLIQYWETKARETREYFASREQKSMTKHSPITHGVNLDTLSLTRSKS